MKQLLLLIFNRDPKGRPTFKEIAGNEWFKGYEKEVFSTVEDLWDQPKPIEKQQTDNLSSDGDILGNSEEVSPI